MNGKRPALRYHGGKFMLAPRVIEHFPPHRVYVEAFGGGASVLLRKPRAYSEVYNDLDDDVVTLFRVLRDPVSAASLKAQLELTPFSRSEYAASREMVGNDVERARRLIVRSLQGFGTDSLRMDSRSGFRSTSNRSGTTPAHDWANYPTHVMQFCERLRGVVIENRDAIAVMRTHDSPETLHYVDPPYVAETRTKGGIYRFELTDEQHEQLAADLGTLRGMVVLSGYRCELYDHLFAAWRRVDLDALADGAQPRVESLWLSPSCHAALHPCLFGGVA